MLDQFMMSHSQYVSWTNKRIIPLEGLLLGFPLFFLSAYLKVPTSLFASGYLLGVPDGLGDVLRIA